MAKVMNAKQIEEELGIPEQQLTTWEKDAENGVFHGEPRGEVVRGRPLKFGQSTKQVGFKEPLAKIEAIDKRAAQLGMRRSDYLRYLVDEDLKRAAL